MSKDIKASQGNIYTGKGKIKKHAQTWHMIGANVSVTDAIQNGHKKYWYICQK